jgi:hypothetical protein
MMLDSMAAHHIQVDLIKMSAIITSMTVMVLVRNTHTSYLAQDRDRREGGASSAAPSEAPTAASQYKEGPEIWACPQLHAAAGQNVPRGSGPGPLVVADEGSSKDAFWPDATELLLSPMELALAQKDASEAFSDQRLARSRIGNSSQKHALPMQRLQHPRLAQF